MSVIRNKNISLSNGKGLQLHNPDGITVKCPKCQSAIVINRIHSDVPVRCSKCNYPMICRSDLMQIVSACKKLTSSDQIASAARILQQLSETLPEAGTALGVLANQQTLPISDRERWSCLLAAYAAGDDDAREWLGLMCQSNPKMYERISCKNCGAPKYVEKSQRKSSVCVFCQLTD